MGSLVLPILLDAAAKGMAILLLTALAALAMRRASAAARHWVWFMGSASLLILPALSAAVPGWHVLPRWELSPGTNARPTQAVIASPNADASAQLPPPLQLDAPPVAAEHAAPALPDAVAPAAPMVAKRSSQIGWGAWVVIAWLGGCMLQIAFIGMGFASLWWLGRRSSGITNGRWLTLLGEVRTEIGFGRGVDLDF